MAMESKSQNAIFKRAQTFVTKYLRQIRAFTTCVLLNVARAAISSGLPKPYTIAARATLSSTQVVTGRICLIYFVTILVNAVG